VKEGSARIRPTGFYVAHNTSSEGLAMFPGVACLRPRGRCTVSGQGGRWLGAVTGCRRETHDREVVQPRRPRYAAARWRIARTITVLASTV
jgi:hypothetical protein